MKTLFYSTKNFEIPYLYTANQMGKEAVFIKERLSLQTVNKAAGFKAISIFTEDDASVKVLEELCKNGTRFVAVRAAGYDNIDLKKAKELGMLVANVPEYSPHAIAEHAVGLMLALNRKIVAANNQVHNQNFSVDNLIGFDLHNKTVGIIGTGKIGSIFAKIMHGFGCNIVAYDINKNQLLIDNYGVKYISLPSLCKEADIISIHTNLTTDTKYIINKNLIDLMQNNVMIINTSRGGCVNTQDIITGLEQKRIGFYGADVYENEKGIFFNDFSGKELKDKMLVKLLTMPNVLITPHQAFATKEALENIAATTFYNLACWKNNESSKNELIKKCCSNDCSKCKVKLKNQ